MFFLIHPKSSKKKPTGPWWVSSWVTPCWGGGHWSFLGLGCNSSQFTGCWDAWKGSFWVVATQRFGHVHPETWGNDPNWPICLRWVETTNSEFLLIPKSLKHKHLTMHKIQWEMYVSLSPGLTPNFVFMRPVIAGLIYKWVPDVVWHLPHLDEKHLATIPT